MKKVTLALGGGGTKGFAHIGVIKQIIELGYEPSAIAGTSAGGIVGALFACGYNTDEIEEFAKSLDYTKLFSLNLSDSPSLLGLSGFFSTLEKYIGDRTFDSLDIPFAVCAIDNNSGEEYVINKGHVLDSLKATTAIPGIFPPFIHKNLSLIDGGILNPVPVNIARWLDDRVPVVAVSLTAPRNKWKELPKYEIPPYFPIPEFVASQFNHMRLGKAIQSFTYSLELMINMVAWLRLKEEKPDILIFPEVYKNTMYADVDIDKMIMLGKQAVINNSSSFNKAFNISNRASRWIMASKPPGKFIEF